MILSCCKLKSDEKLQLNTSIPNSVKKPFNPSPSIAFQLIKRKDGFFDSSIEIKYTDNTGKTWKGS